MTLDDYTAIASWRGRKIADMSKEELLAVVIELDRMLYVHRARSFDAFEKIRAAREATR